MTAIIIDPFAVDETSLTDTNLTESTSEWDSGTTYAAGDDVHVTTERMVYTSAIDGNLGNDPVTDTVGNWIPKAAMNKWAAFDAYQANPASRAENITIEITVDQIVNAIAFFKLKAQSVTVTVDKDAQSTVYDIDLNNYEYIDGSWYNWFFGGRQFSEAVKLTDAVYYGVGSKVTIEINNPSKTAEVGQIVLGRGYKLGDVLANINLKNQSFSKIENDEFGNTTIIRRPIVTEYDMNVSTDNGNVVRTQRIVKKLTEVPTAFIGSDNSQLGLTVFGMLSSAQPQIPHKDHHVTRVVFRELI